MTEHPNMPEGFALAPEFLTEAEEDGVSAEEFRESLVTEYQPGAGTGWDRDAPPFGLVTGISLAAECRMRFQKGTGAERLTAAVTLPRRSLYRLTGAARSEWQHTIRLVRELRYSWAYTGALSHSAFSKELRRIANAAAGRLCASKTPAGTRLGGYPRICLGPTSNRRGRLGSWDRTFG